MRGPSLYVLIIYYGVIYGAFSRFVAFHLAVSGSVHIINPSWTARVVGLGTLHMYICTYVPIIINK